MELAANCKNLTEVRNCIDELDKQIIGLIGKRHNYVKKAAEFKTDEQAVKAPDRFKNMLQKRRDWAKGENLNPDVIAKIYTDLVNYFIEEELTTWKQQK